MAQFRLPDELTPVLTELRGLTVPAMGEAKATSPPRALDDGGKRDDGCGVKHWLWSEGCRSERGSTPTTCAGQSTPGNSPSTLRMVSPASVGWSCETALSPEGV